MTNYLTVCWKSSHIWLEKLFFENLFDFSYFDAFKNLNEKSESRGSTTRPLVWTAHEYTAKPHYHKNLLEKFHVTTAMSTNFSEFGKHVYIIGRTHHIVSSCRTYGVSQTVEYCGSVSAVVPSQACRS